LNLKLHVTHETISHVYSITQQWCFSTESNGSTVSLELFKCPFQLSGDRIANAYIYDAIQANIIPGFESRGQEIAAECNRRIPLLTGGRVFRSFYVLPGSPISVGWAKGTVGDGCTLVLA
jgi:hypothetical protein